jgi:kynurenine formamidase
MKIIDLSVTISEKIKEPLPTTIVYEDHKEGAKKMGGRLFDGLTDVFVDGNGPAGELLTVTSHCGTHVDAPYHYFPTSEGKPSRTIDEMPWNGFSRMALC